MGKVLPPWGAGHDPKAARAWDFRGGLMILCGISLRRFQDSLTFQGTAQHGTFPALSQNPPPPEWPWPQTQSKSTTKLKKKFKKKKVLLNSNKPRKTPPSPPPGIHSGGPHSPQLRMAAAGLVPTACQALPEVRMSVLEVPCRTAATSGCPGWHREAPGAQPHQSHSLRVLPAWPPTAQGLQGGHCGQGDRVRALRTWSPPWAAELPP